MYRDRIFALSVFTLLTVWALPMVFADAADAEADTAHDYIQILDNDEFTQENGVTDGTGVLEDPYIIEGWDIEGMGVYVENTDAHLVIRNVSVTTGYADVAISVRNVSNVLISDCALDGYGNGVFVWSSQDVRIVENTISCGGADMLGSNTMLMAIDCQDFEVRGNTLTDEGLFGALRCTEFEFIENEVTDSRLSLWDCTKASITDNILAQGVELSGDDVEHYDSHEMAGNTAGGYSIIYVADKESKTYSNANLGQVIAVSCGSIDISRIDFKSAAGACIYFSETVTVADCIILESETGIYAHNCSEVVVARCYISNALYGVRALGVDTLNVSGSFFDECHNCVRLHAEDVGIQRNMFLDSHAAVGVDMLDTAEIFGNNFVNVVYPMMLYGSPSTPLDDIVWDGGYPTGGNYWEEYSGTDEFSGPDQDEPDADGIGDTAYIDEDELVVDRYPLMMPVEAEFGPEVVTDEETDTSSQVGPLTIALAAVAAAVCVLGAALYAINRSRRIRQRPPEL